MLCGNMIKHMDLEICNTLYEHRKKTEIRKGLKLEFDTGTHPETELVL